MNIFLTGGTGFIGSHFLRQALSAGHYVKAVRRNPSSQPRIPVSQKPDWLDRQLDELSCKDLQGSDVLVHLAAHSVQFPFDNLSNCLYWNLNAVLSMVEQARIAGIRRFVVAGSCFEYGHSGERYAAIPSDAPLEPTNSYAASKAAASIALRQWAEEHKLSLEIIRVFHVYGEGEAETRFWPSLRRAALTGEDFSMTRGEQIRDFMRVQDVASIFLRRATSNSFSHSPSIKNLGAGNPLSLRQFAYNYWHAWNSRGRLLFGQLPYRNCEIMRLVPKIDLTI